MNEIDFHGMTIEEALQLVDKTIDKVRVAGKELDYKFITGNGPLQLAILDKLKNEYGLQCGLQFCNHGVILVYIE